MMVSDTTGNVKKCRALACSKWPWILNCGDPAHQLNLMSKDLILGSKKFPKIKPFADLMSSVAAVTNFFSHSNYGRYHLDKEMDKESDKRGIEPAATTRFSSFSIHSTSVQRCFPAMQRARESGTLKFDTKAVSSL